MVKSKIVKSAILLFLFVFVLIPIIPNAQAKQNQSREISTSFKLVKPFSNNLDFSEQSENNGTNTASLIVSHGSVSYSTFSDYNGNGYYRRTVYWFDIDSNKKVNYYVIFYLNNNEGYGWYTDDGLKSDVYTIDGYSPEEGVYIGNLFWSGYKEATEGVKIELYLCSENGTDGTLVDTYGPDDNPDLGNIKIESIEFDLKRNPFATPKPSPTPTPDDDVSKITGYIIDKDGNNIGNVKVVARKDGETVATVSSDENGEFLLENLEHGEYSLQVTKKGYKRKIVTVVIEEDGDEKVVIEMKKKR